jgi:hypothetical protein
MGQEATSPAYSITWSAREQRRGNFDAERFSCF